MDKVSWLCRYRGYTMGKMNKKQKDKLPLISDEELKEIMLPTDKLIEIALNDFDEQLRLDEMKKWNAEEQARYLCPNGVMSIEESKELDIK